MNTPITDAVFGPQLRGYRAETCRKLELDRAALMEAATDYLNPFACRQKAHEKLMAAVAAARANFPEQP